MNVIRDVSLAELDALETLENSPIHTVSSILVSPEEQLIEVVNLLCDSVTPLLSSHDDVITNLDSDSASTSGGASTCVPSTNNNTYPMASHTISPQSVSPHKPLQALRGGIQQSFDI